MDSPSSPGTGALVVGVTTVFLTIIAFGAIASRVVVGDREAAQVTPVVAPSSAAPTGEQPGVPPAAVKPDDKEKLEGVTAPPSQQPADAVNPGSGKMPDSKPKP